MCETVAVRLAAGVALDEAELAHVVSCPACAASAALVRDWRPRRVSTAPSPLDPARLRARARSRTLVRGVGIVATTAAFALLLLWPRPAPPPEPDLLAALGGLDEVALDPADLDDDAFSDPDAFDPLEDL